MQQLIIKNLNETMNFNPTSTSLHLYKPLESRTPFVNHDSELGKVVSKALKISHFHHCSLSTTFDDKFPVISKHLPKNYFGYSAIGVTFLTM